MPRRVTNYNLNVIPENHNALLVNAQYADAQGLGLASLQRAGLLTPENRGALLANAQYADALELGLASLQRAGLLTQPNFDTLLANAQYAAALEQGLYSLQSAGLLTQPNFDTLLANAQYAQDLGRGLSSLQRADLLTQPNFDTLLANAQYAAALEQGLYSLQSAGLLTQPNFETLLLGKGAHAQALADYCSHFEGTDHLTLTQKRFDHLMESTWGGARLAATMLGLRNRDPAAGPKLPAEIIGLIASFLVPDYSEDRGIVPYSIDDASKRAELYSTSIPEINKGSE